MRSVRFLLLVFLACFETTHSQAIAAEPPDIFDRSNLAAWCIVPYDGKKRGPEERAAMLEKLGIKRLAYDYRPEHIPQFDAEMEALKKHGIELTAWWFPLTLGDEAKNILNVIKRHRVRPQLWVMSGNTGTPANEAETKERIENEARRLGRICEAAAPLALKVCLYNHGGWFGEPENQIAILEQMKRNGITNCGMVYNQHHGQAHLKRFPALFEKMKPWLRAFNLNGMSDTDPEDQITPVGQGNLDVSLLQLVHDSGWRGPVGILNHTNEDAELRLQDNLDGVMWVSKEMAKPGSGGARPVPRSWKAPEVPAKPKKITTPDGKTRWQVAFGQNPPAGLTVDETVFRELPVTVEVRAKLTSAAPFNILTAADPKISRWHWELYSYAGTGTFCAYLPGRGGNFDSGVSIADGAWHDTAAIIESNRIRLYVDGVLKKDAVLTSPPAAPLGKGFALGQLVEGSIGCEGRIAKVRVRRGVHGIEPGEWATATRDTLGQWEFVEPPPVRAPPAVAAFPFDAAPLVPEQWPNRMHPVNRERIYDFYAKEAQWFMKQTPVPPLLPEYPGLDGGRHGHWGNQNEEVWRDGRWNQMDIGPRMGGVFRGGGVVVAKAVCVKLGESGGLAACFDPETAAFKTVWKDGFVRFSDARHGFMDGLFPTGAKVDAGPGFSVPAPPEKLHYRGYYRHGMRTIFSYRLDGVDMLDAAWEEGGKPQRLRGPAAEHPWRDMIKGGPAQWPQTLETRGTKGTPQDGWPYVIDTLTLPADNPWKTLFFIGGHDFFSSGDIALCTMTGDVWRVSGVDESLEHLRWKRVAAGLHQPLGLVVVDDKICVLGRDQITRLHDLNGDGEADFYECVTNGYPTSRGGHDFICGLERDGEGRFYSVSSAGGLFRINEGGKAETLATGFRNPDGLSLAPDGTITLSVQEGEWTPASSIVQAAPQGYYGYPGPRPSVETLLPLLYLPRGIDNSCGGQTWVPDDRWGPLRGQLIHFSQGAATHHLVLRQNVSGQWQGAAVPLPGDFLSGVHRGRFSPQDGQLYVTGMNGWGVYAPDDGCLQRVRFTGGPVQLPVAWEARDNGILLAFSAPLDAAAADPAKHFAQCWSYRYGQAYGSPEFSLRWPGTPGHDPLVITSAHVLNGGRSLFLEIPQLQPAPQIHLLLQPEPSVHREMFLTVHKLGPAFTDFPGYKAIAKESPASAVLTSVAESRVNPWKQGARGRPLRIEAANGLQFATKELKARAGERVSLTFSNPDTIPHNWVLLNPGAVEKTGDLANKLITDPDGPSRHYVPETPDVLSWTDMVPPAGSFTIHFDAPAKQGDYPYICTFPGHWMLMRGVLKVE
ncbi:MAG TPA: DUF6797 domain-containing protein [Verrucomicrobiales bacterium]|nr:DUF6797 domain-containing protein [Verrucomicrobiales bacterium]